MFFVPVFALMDSDTSLFFLGAVIITSAVSGMQPKVPTIRLLEVISSFLLVFCLGVCDEPSSRVRYAVLDSMESCCALGFHCIVLSLQYW